MRLALAGLLLLTAACRSDSGFTALDYRQLGDDHGQWLSMKSAPDGRLALTFYNRTIGAIGFALGTPFRDELRWEYEKVAGYPDSTGLNPGDVGTHTSLAFAPDGTAWASFHGNDNGALMVAHRVNRSWTAEVVDAGSGLRPKTGLWTSIAIDGSGEPVIAYHDEVAGTLNVARRSGGAWSHTIAWQGQPYSGPDANGNPVERPADVGEYVQLTIVGNTEYLVFFDRASESLVLLEGFANAYSATVVDTGGVGQWPSLVLDGDLLGIAYHDIARQDLKLAVRQGGGNFRRSTLDDAPYRGADTALYRRDGKWRVVYFDGRSNDARLAAQGDGETFALRQIGGDTTAVGFHNEVARDGSGRWWTVSYDYTNRNLFSAPLED
jgi:hypothetical protein